MVSIIGEKHGFINISRLYIAEEGSDTPEIVLIVEDKFNYIIKYNDKKLEGKIGELLEANGLY